MAMPPTSTKTNLFVPQRLDEYDNYSGPKRKDTQTTPPPQDKEKELKEGRYVPTRVPNVDSVAFQRSSVLPAQSQVAVVSELAIC